MKISKPLKETGWTEDEIHKRLDSILEEDIVDVTEIEDIDEIIEHKKAHQSRWV
ncbi:hypothetical protein [Mammaliicoccus sciuri]|uniref:hypothetical protein n=1 Tax=Mammaliicoccus sciuri TaxID=1296 RepID=UPI00163A770E|nr:hypothetical protein [Mammaliicoccus sciuri]